MPFGQEQVSTMIEYSRSVVEDFDGFRLEVPAWYEP